MKCPVCENDDSQVIDSRPIKNNLGIRRRRECKSCSSRFTTYESEIGSLLQVVLNHHSGSSTELSSITSTLYFTMKTLDILSKEMKAIAYKTELHETHDASNSEVEKINHSLKPKHTKPLTEKIMEIINQYEKGINIPELKNETGYDDKKIRNILYRATLDGKIKKIDRGVYAKK